MGDLLPRREAFVRSFFVSLAMLFAFLVLAPSRVAWLALP